MAKSIDSILMSKEQQKVFEEALRGEEKEFFSEKLEEFKKNWSDMPNIHGQEHKSDEAIAYLHYFKNDFHIYLTERDPESLEVFGLMGRIGGDQDREKGYQSIENIREAGFELDLHFTPATLNAIMEAEKSALEQVGADALLESMPLDMAWPEGMDVAAASAALSARMAAQGKEIIGDIRAAYFEKIEAAQEEGRELTPGQQEFFDEESESRKRNPLYQKPKPI
jgi:hypothetical protein